MTTMRRTRRGPLVDAARFDAASLEACGEPDSVVRNPVAGLAPDGLVKMRKVQIAYMGSADTGRGTLFYRDRPQGAGEGEAGPSVAVEHAAEGGEAGMLRHSDHAPSRRCCCAFAEGTAAGLAVHDHGSRYMASAFQREPRSPGIRARPSSSGRRRGTDARNGSSVRSSRTCCGCGPSTPSKRRAAP